MAGQMRGLEKNIALPRQNNCSRGNVPLAAAHKSFVAAISLDTKLR